MKILLAPLNWGLGHATRDIPIIHALLNKGVEVVLAADGAALSLLKKEFPNLKAIELPAWNITYPKNGNFAMHLLFQSGKVLKAIIKEHKFIEQLVDQEGIDVIISDNRLGCFSKKVKSIVISHQLCLESPIIKTWINKANQRFLSKFNEVWIPDVPGGNNLAGSLSNSQTMPVKSRYIGVLSRFSKKPVAEEQPTIEILASISGPEPQRTLFEQELVPMLQKLNVPVVVLLGKPQETYSEFFDGNLTFYSHLPSQEIESLMNRSKVVIARTGYTTVMDLVTLNKRAILVPTPGQTEQEFLGKVYADKGWFVIQKQGQINVEKGLKELVNTKVPVFDSLQMLHDAIDSLFVETATE